MVKGFLRFYCSGFSILNIKSMVQYLIFGFSYFGLGVSFFDLGLGLLLGLGLSFFYMLLGLGFRILGLLSKV